MFLPHAYMQEGNCEVIDVLTNLIAVIISQDIRLSKDHTIHLKLTHYYLSVTSQ